MVHKAVEGSGVELFREARDGWGTVEERPFPYTAATLAAAAETLRTLAERWCALTPGAELAFTWPNDLAAPIPTTRR